MIPQSRSPSRHPRKRIPQPTLRRALRILRVKASAVWSRGAVRKLVREGGHGLTVGGLVLAMEACDTGAGVPACCVARHALLH